MAVDAGFFARRLRLGAGSTVVFAVALLLLGTLLLAMRCAPVEFVAVADTQRAAGRGYADDGLELAAFETSAGGERPPLDHKHAPGPLPELVAETCTDPQFANAGSSTWCVGKWCSEPPPRPAYPLPCTVDSLCRYEPFLDDVLTGPELPSGVVRHFATPTDRGAVLTAEYFWEEKFGYAAVAQDPRDPSRVLLYYRTSFWRGNRTSRDQVNFHLLTTNDMTAIAISHDTGLTFARPSLEHATMYGDKRMDNVLWEDGLSRLDVRRAHNFAVKPDLNPQSRYRFRAIAGGRDPPRTTPSTWYHRSVDGVRWEIRNRTTIDFVPSDAHDSMNSVQFDVWHGRYVQISRSNVCGRSSRVAVSAIQSSGVRDFENYVFPSRNALLRVRRMSHEEFYQMDLDPHPEAPHIFIMLAYTATKPRSGVSPVGHSVADRGEQLRLFVSRDGGLTATRLHSGPFFDPKWIDDFAPYRRDGWIDTQPRAKNWVGVFHGMLPALGFVHDEKRGTSSLYVVLNVHLARNWLDDEDRGKGPHIRRLEFRWGGLASLRGGSGANNCSVLTTKPIPLCGKALYLNTRPFTPDGFVQIRVLDEEGFAVSGVSEPITADGVRVPVLWQDRPFVPSISSLHRLEITLCGAEVFGFRCCDAD